VRQNRIVTFTGGQDPLLAELAAAVTSAPPDAAVWRAWLADEATCGRFAALTYRRGPGRCAYWLGAISSSGHGKFRAGSRARDSGGESRIVSAHVFAYQLEHGVLPGDLVVRHRCDEASCMAGEHLVSGTQPENVSDYLARRRGPGPLADRRGAQGRAIAIRDAVRAALRAGTDPEAALAAAIADGIGGQQDPLF
jgi:hypothetical protein